MSYNFFSRFSYIFFDRGNRCKKSVWRYLTRIKKNPESFIGWLCCICYFVIPVSWKNNKMSRCCLIFSSQTSSQIFSSLITAPIKSVIIPTFTLNKRENTISSFHSMNILFHLMPKRRDDVFEKFVANVKHLLELFHLKLETF